MISSVSPRGSRDILVMVPSAFSIADHFGVFETPQIERDQGEQLIAGYIANGKPQANSDLVKAASNLEPEFKFAVVRELVRAAKAYVETPAFQSNYTKWRDEQLSYATKPTNAVRNPLGMLERKPGKKLNVKKDESNYRAKADNAVKLRLQEFLDLSATVDFSARRARSCRFENSAYKAKPNEWKACCRAVKRW